MEICSAERQTKLHWKKKVKFRTFGIRISVVYNRLVQQEGASHYGVFKFMTVFVAERDSACFWLRVVFVSPLRPSVDNIHIL